MRFAPPEGFVFVRLLSQSQTSAVFEVAKNGKLFVCKRLSERMADEAEARAQFVRETEVLEWLAGRASPVLEDHGEDSNGLFLRLKRIDGVRLTNAEPAPEIKVHESFSALATVHEAGVIHGDISPSNVLVSKNAAWLIDFGLSHFTQDKNVHSTSFSGTLKYAAPECVRGECTDERSDIFSLGASLLFALTGLAPRESSSAASMMRMAAEDSLEPYLERCKPLVSSPIFDDLARCVAFDPAERPRSARVVFP